MKTNTTSPTRALRFLALAVMAWPLLVSAQSLLTQWDGGRNTDLMVPPDPHGAAGPSGVIGTYNVSITYYTKSGNIIWGPTNLHTFSGNTGQGLSDPKVIYDSDSQRFFVIHQENTTANHSFLNIAVSRSSDPRTGSTADWFIYRVEMTEYSDGQTNGGDYPGFALDWQAVYVTYNMFRMTNGVIWGGALNSQLFTYNKAQMIAGGYMNGSSMDLSGSNLQPVTPVGTSTPGNRVYLIQSYNNTQLKLWSIDDPLGVGTVNSTSITIPDNGGGSGLAPQFGVTNQIDTLDLRAQAAVYRGGSLWMAHTAGPAGGPSKVYYYRINPNGYPSGTGTPTLTESGTVGESGYWNFQPAIGANGAGDVAVVYTRSSTNAYPTMMYVYRSAGDGAFGSSQVVTNSGGPSIAPGGDRPWRWGDFAAVSADPIDGTLWITHEYARTGGQNDWGTYFAQIGTPAYDLYVNVASHLPCIFGSGTVTFPYCRVGQAVDAATHGTIHIAGGHYNEPMIIKKAVTLTTWLNNGDVVIGAP